MNNTAITGKPKLNGYKASGMDQSWDSAKHDHVLIRLSEAHTELAHQILAKSDQRFACKCAEITQ